MYSLRAYFILTVFLLTSSLGLIGQTISVFPTYDDLETWDTCSQLCGTPCVISSDWSNQGGIDFRTDSAGTPTSITGPTIDKNPGTAVGKYAYVESSSPCNPDTALLESPYIDLSAVVDPEFAFAHHLRWAQTAPDTFEVLVSTDSGSTWAVGFTGPNVTSSTSWVEDTMDLSTYIGSIIKLRIQFVTGANFHDFAVDDFAFLGIQETDAGVDSVFSSNGFCLGDSSSICINLVNEGLVPIDTVTIRSSLNGGVLFPTFDWTSTLAPGEDTIICVGNVLLSQGDSIAFYSDMPNGELDTFNLNDTFSLTVNLNALPIVNAGVDTTACALDSFQLGGNPTAAGINTYDWSNASLLNDSTLSNPTVYFTQSGTFDFEVIVQDSNLCINEDTVSITIYPITSVDAGIDTAICIGDSVMLGGTPTAPATATVQWTNAASLSNNTAQNPNASPPITTEYEVTIIDINGCDFKDSVVVTIHDLPALDPGPDTNACFGNSVVIGGSPTALQFDTIVWTPAATLDNTALANPSATPLVNTRYYIQLTDTHGCVFNDSVDVTVVPLPAADAGGDQTVCAFESFQVGGSPTGPANSTFSWSPTALFNNAALANPMVTVTQDTQLVVSVTDTISGCSDTDTIQISIRPLPLAEAGPASIDICKNDTVSLGGNPTTSSGYGVSWSPGVDLNDSIIFNPLITADTSYTIVLTTTDTTFLCQNFDSIQINVNPLPLVDAGVGDTICLGDSAFVGGAPTSSLGGSYLWSDGQFLLDSTASNPIAIPDQDVMFMVQVTTNDGCRGFDSVLVMVDTIPVIVVAPVPVECLNDPVQLQVAGGDTFAWNNGQFLNDDSIDNPVATPPGNQQFIVTVTDANGCSDTAHINVVFDTLPLVEAGMGDTICFGESTGLMASNAINYTWSPTGSLTGANTTTPTATPSVTTIYTVTGTDGNGCTGTDSVTVMVNQLPIVDAGPDVDVCQNDSVQLGGSPTAPSGSIYNWDNSNINDVTAANPYFVSGNIAVGNYNVGLDVVDVNGCENSDQIVVTVLDDPDAQINPISSTICIGETLSISATGGSQYQWSPIGTVTSANASQTGVFPIVSTTYTVTVTDVNGCSATASALVPVHPLTQADAGADVQMCQQDTIQLTATGGVQYQWSNPFLMDGENTATPKVYPVQTTTFIVTVTDLNGCSETDNVQVIVNPLPIAAGGADQRICVGEEIQIGGNPTGPSGSQYVWSSGSSLDDNALANPVASPIATTLYRVTVTSNNGCQDSADVLVQVDSIPVIKLTSVNTPICRNDTLMIAITPGYSSYQWSPNQQLLNGDNDTIYVYPRLDKSYSVTATNGRNCSSDFTVDVNVWQLPEVSVSDEKEICEGDSTFISAEGGVLYAWSDGFTLNDSMSQNVIASPSATTLYTITVTDTNGCENTGMGRVVVYPKPFVEAGDNIENCDIEVVRLGGEPSGSADAVYTWTPQAGLNDPFHPNPTVLNPEATVYYLEVQNRDGCFNTDSVLVNADCFTLVYAPTSFSPGFNGLNDEFLLSHYRVEEPELRIWNKWGNLIFETKDLDVGWDGTLNGRPVQSDTYYWFLSYKTHDFKKASKEGTVTLIR